MAAVAEAEAKAKATAQKMNGGQQLTRIGFKERGDFKVSRRKAGFK